MILSSIWSHISSGSHRSAHEFGAHPAILCLCSGENCALNCSLFIRDSLNLISGSRSSCILKFSHLRNRVDVSVSIFLTPVEVGIRKMEIKISISYLVLNSTGINKCYPLTPENLTSERVTDFLLSTLGLLVFCLVSVKA